MVVLGVKSTFVVPKLALVHKKNAFHDCAVAGRKPLGHFAGGVAQNPPESALRPPKVELAHRSYFDRVGFSLAKDARLVLALASEIYGDPTRRCTPSEAAVPPLADRQEALDIMAPYIGQINA